MEKKLSRKFTKIYNHNIKQIYRFVYIKVSSQEIAEDLTSEVFIRFWRTYKNGREDKIDNPQAFLYKMARNIVIDYYRSRPELRTISVEEIKEIPDPKQHLEKKEMIISDQEKLQRGLNKIKEDYQDVILWYYIDDLSVNEIAGILDKSENAVRVMIHRAMNNLKKSLEEV